MAGIDGAEYIYTVSNNPQNIRARGRVKPGNAAAHEDDARNSTLLKALASVGSDPHPYAGAGYTGAVEGISEEEFGSETTGPTAGAEE